MATTTNYSWTTPDDTALVKDGAAAIRTLGSSVDTTVKNLNPETTLGDIAYRSSTANVKTRLALGTAGQILAVNSGATAPEWVAAPSSGAGNLAQVASGSLSGSSVSLTGLSSYSVLYLGLYSVDLSGNDSVWLTLNADTSTNYTNYGGRFTSGPAGARVANTNVGKIYLSAQAAVSGTTITNSFFTTVENSKTTGFSNVNVFGNFTDSNGSDVVSNVSAIYKVSAAITSLQIVTGEFGNTFSAGTYVLWGA